MITVRRSSERGHTNVGWLESYHTFSFNRYHDPAHMGFRSLRVVNDDLVQPGLGFPIHTHQDMEIITYVLEGSLQHQDSTGSRNVIGPGGVQVMTAGSGMAHSEYNPSQTKPVHFLQIWIVPKQNSLKPSFEHRSYTRQERWGQLCPIATPSQHDDVPTINQDATIHTTLLDTGQQCAHRIRPGRHLWVQVARGSVLANDELLGDGDGARVIGEDGLVLLAQSGAEVLLFDLP